MTSTKPTEDYNNSFQDLDEKSQVIAGYILDGVNIGVAGIMLLLSLVKLYDDNVTGKLNPLNPQLEGREYSKLSGLFFSIIPLLITKILYHGYRFVKECRNLDLKLEESERFNTFRHVLGIVILVVGLGLLGVAGYFFILRGVFDAATAEGMRHILEAMVALGFGASLISIFARLGGGIFTKGADVGADLVGKIEAGIPEDDPRNAAVIADNVGDNVGDCAGMAADLFETYGVTMVATMLLAVIYFTGSMQDLLITLPLLIGGVCIVGSIIGFFFVRLGSGNNIMGALYKGLIVSMIASAVLIGVAIHWLFGSMSTVISQQVTSAHLFYCALIGLLVTGLLVWITEYYTGTNHRPVKQVAKASETGHGTNVIQGLAISMEATALPVLVICAGIIASYFSADLYGIAIAATTMLALGGVIVALDAYCPVTDNAGVIAEMAELPE